MLGDARKGGAMRGNAGIIKGRKKLPFFCELPTN
jgi:hypothetical protein